MIKKIGILLLVSIVTLPVYAQKKDKNEIVIEQDWKENHFTSNQTLMENIKEVEEVKQMMSVLIKGAIDELSTSEESLSIFIPLDIALDKMSRKERKAFLENTSKSELNQMWKEYIIPGRLDEYAIKRNIENKNAGSIFVRTLGSNQLEFVLKNDEVYVRDVYGNEAKLVKGDFYHNHGFFHFIDNLLYFDKK